MARVVRLPLIAVTAAACIAMPMQAADAFVLPAATSHDSSYRPITHRPSRICNSNSWKGQDSTDNDWKTNDTYQQVVAGDDDWETILKKKRDGSYWSDFAPSRDDESSVEVDEADQQLERLFAVQAEEVEFVTREAERADKARQMQEWGFDASTIASALNVAVEERPDEMEGMQSYRETSYLDTEDLTTLESHTRVPKDPVTNEPLRSQMVYVDEHTCIGCTK